MNPERNEFMKGNQELLKGDHESSVETYKPADKQAEKLSVNPETSVELSPRDVETKTEKARIEALETAKASESAEKEKTEKRIVTSRRGSIGKKERDKSFVQTMHQVQSELPLSSRLFSKVIHGKFIERTSDIVGNTVARPNAILAGAFMAFVLTLIAYTVAKSIGYKLSGFETIVAFVIGWTIGIIYDYLRILLTGKKY